jgi:hypothetical protein
MASPSIRFLLKDGWEPIAFPLIVAVVVMVSKIEKVSNFVELPEAGPGLVWRMGRMGRLWAGVSTDFLAWRGNNCISAGRIGSSQRYRS